MPEPVTVPTLVPPEVLPVKVTSPVAKLVVGSLNTTVKLIGLVPVGSPWPPAWLMVTVGGVVSWTQLTVLSVEVDAVLPLPAASVAAPAAIEAMTVPDVVIPVTATL